MLKKPSHISPESTAPRTGRTFRDASGFSMLELVIVIAISVTIAAIAIPTFLTAMYDIRLKSAATDLSGFMQRARLQAARQNATYPIVYQSVTGADEAFIDLNNDGLWEAPEPLLTFSPTVTMASGAPTGTGGSPTPYVLVGDTAGTIYDNATKLAYSPRGLPCAYIANVCSTPAAGYFVYYLTTQRPGGSISWAGVVVTRAGRTKTVVWSGTAWQ